MSFQALWKFNPSGCCSVIPSNPRPSSSLACSNGPTSIARSPPSRESCATVSLAPSSSPAINTSSGWPATWPSTSVPEKVVLKALTTLAPAGTVAAISSAAEVPAEVTRASKVSLRGLEMSTTTLPASLQQGEPRGVEQAHRTGEPIQHGASEERNETGGRCRREIPPVAERGRRQRPQEDVARDPADEPDDPSQDDDSEEVQPGAYSHEAPAEAEGEGPGQVQRQQQCRPLRVRHGGMVTQEPRYTQLRF